MTNIRVLLVDDYPDFIDSVSQFLSTNPQIEIVGRASSGQQALEQVSQLAPDLVLMDLVMPGMSGLEATSLLKARSDTPRVVIITLHDNLAYRNAAKAAGADSFVCKDEVSERLGAVVHELFGGTD